jgi:argininosuccinate lyase
MKLWSKDNTSTSALIEKFTVGNDVQFDLLLAKHDIIGSIAHARMLQQVGILTGEECDQMVQELNNMLVSAEKGTFRIDAGVEDVHSQVEMLLTQRVGDAGKKIHTGRSRNDQVAVDIKLYLRHEIMQIKDLVAQLFDVLIGLSEANKNSLMPGYTHLQVAMPSSFGLWLGAFAESLVDDLELLATAYTIVNKNPLGSGAGYGSSFPLNRTATTQLLQFGALNYNSIYAQTGRGKAEKITAFALSSIAATLNKLCADICLYVGQDYGFISFPNEITTGSSLMPHKKNPDVFELTRARCSVIQGIPNTLTLLLNNMPSGYHRDVQLTKEILFPAIESLKQCLEMQMVVLPQMSVRNNILAAEKYKYIFSVEAVNELVKKGIPFRDAYKQVGNDIEAGTFAFDAGSQLSHTHEGSIGHLCNDEVAGAMKKVLGKFV